MPSPKERKFGTRFLPRSERSNPLPIHEALRKEREARELTQADLAVLLGHGWTQSKVARVELGETRLHADELHAVAEALGITVWRLLRLTPPAFMAATRRSVRRVDTKQNEAAAG